jgi:hypothetical protein
MRKILRSACLAVAAAGVLLTMSVSAAGAQAGSGRPAIGPFPGRSLPAIATTLSGYSLLYGVFCPSATDCWAVGQRSRGEQLANLVLHWNGKHWSQSAVPNPSQADDELFNVRCLNAKDCWAVGEDLKGNAFVAEAFHWNGKKWSTTTVPAYGGTKMHNVTEIYDSTCTAANSCWAVGDFGLGDSPPIKLFNLVLHWNGTKWSRVHPPNPGGSKTGDLSFLDSVRCVSASDCNAIGGYGTITSTKDVELNEVMHWNGRRWSWVHVPNPAGTGSGTHNELDTLACGAKASCWAVGLSGANEPTQTNDNEILHWNGARWTHATAPNPGGTKLGASNALDGATCNSSASCWAVGDYLNSHGVTVNQALHWNGKRWYYVGTPDPVTAIRDSNQLYQVRCVSSTDCWAVGGSQPYLGVQKAEILHWNGRKWSIFPA